MNSFQILSWLNFLLVTVTLGYSIFAFFKTKRPVIRRHAIQMALFAFVYFLVFGSRVLFNLTARRAGFIGEIGTSIAPLVFYFVWLSPLRTMVNYTEIEDNSAQMIKQQSMELTHKINELENEV